MWLLASVVVAVVAFAAPSAPLQDAGVSYDVVGGDGRLKLVRVGRGELPRDVFRPAEDLPQPTSSVFSSAGGAADADAGVLFTINLKLSEDKEPVPFVATRGGNVFRQASQFADEIGLDRDDKALLLEAAKQYAQAAGAMPLREMSFDLSAGGTFRLSIYEGDKTDELRERVVAAGAGEDEADLILGTALLTLQQERLIPMVVSQVFVRGKEAAVSVFKDDSIAAVVGSFAMKYNLSAEDTALLLEHVQAEAFRHRAVPMLVIPVSMPEVETRLKIYYGDSIRERVATFAEEYGLAEAAKESLLEHATRSAARNSFIPFVSFTPDFTGPQGESLPDLQIWARDNVTRAVQDYADFHLLTDEQERAMLKEAVAKAKAAGVLPLLSLRVGINATEGDTEHLLATFDLFEGDGLEAAVDRFAARYGLDQEGRGNLLRHAKEAAQVQRLLPVLTTSHQLALPGGAPVTVAVAVMDGDDPGVNAVAAAFAAGVNETEAAVLARAVVEEAMRLRLLPVLRIRAEKNKDKSEVEFKMFQGEDLAEAVELFAKANDLGDVDRRELLSYALEQAKDAGLVPALRIPVGVRTEEGEVTKHVEVFKGQDVLERSAAFAREWALNEDMADRLRSHIVEAARAERLLPIMILPVEVPVLKKSGGDRRVLAARLEIFRGDTAEEAAARAVEALEEEVEEGIMTALAKAAREAGVARRIFPMLRLNATIQTSEANATVEVELYRGDNVTEAVARAASRAGLLKGKETEGELLAALAAQTRAQAVRARVLPTLTVPVDLPSGNAEPLNLFLGDNITQVVEAWGKVHGLEGDDLEELQQATLERAQAARVAPILSISVRLGPEQGGSAPLELFQGDNVTAAVRAFMARHGLATGGERERSLVADVTSAAVDLRLLPQHEVPVRATTQPGEGRPAREIEAVFHFFKGDDLRTAAAAFVDEKELGASSLPGLLRFLEQKIPLPSEGSHSELQP